MSSLFEIIFGSDRTPDCVRGVHKFEPRWDYGDLAGNAEAKTRDVVQLAEVLCRRRYIGDVCVVCGKWTHAPKP